MGPRPYLRGEICGANLTLWLNRAFYTNRLCNVAKGHEKEFESRFEGRAGLVDKMPGFIRFEILKPIQSDYYVVLTCWENRDAFRAWTESREFQEAQP